ncbi:hypothetical protein SCYAM73S_02653 [Streptomyces cyaneofuscatus]
MAVRGRAGGEVRGRGAAGVAVREPPHPAGPGRGLAVHHAGRRSCDGPVAVRARPGGPVRRDRAAGVAVRGRPHPGRPRHGVGVRKGVAGHGVDPGAAVAGDRLGPRRGLEGARGHRARAGDRGHLAGHDAARRPRLLAVPPRPRSGRPGDRGGRRGRLADRRVPLPGGGPGYRLALPAPGRRTGGLGVPHGGRPGRPLRPGRALGLGPARRRRGGPRGPRSPRHRPGNRAAGPPRRLAGPGRRNGRDAVRGTAGGACAYSG